LWILPFDALDAGAGVADAALHRATQGFSSAEVVNEDDEEIANY
jgi:hypothetical protein